MEQEFTKLLYQNQGIAYKVCNLYFGERNDKEDLLQEIIIQLWKAFPTFKNQSKFSTWMYRVCLNAAIDISRKEKTKLSFVYLKNENLIHLADDKKENTNQELLYRAISKLNDIDKAIITLYLDEFSYKEIAEIAGISESNTGVKINRIKSEIIKKLK